MVRIRRMGRLTIWAVMALALITACRIRNTPPEAPAAVLGPDKIGRGVSYNYTTSAIDPDGDSVACQFDWGDTTSSNWSDFAASAEYVQSAKAWSVPGTYPVKARARDTRGAISSWSAAHVVRVPDPDTLNQPPAPEIIAGPDTAYVSFIYQFLACAADPEGESVSVRFDWGDGTTSEWSPFVASGETIRTEQVWSHWSGNGIRAQAKDTHDTMSDWSAVREVNLQSSPGVIWQRVFGAPAAAVCVTADGGYGVTGGLGGGVLLVKIAADGALLWMNTYRVGSSAAGNSIQMTSDGDLVIAGIELTPTRKLNIFLLRVDPAGETVGTKTYGDTLTYYYNVVVKATPDHGFVVAGNAESDTDGQLRILLLRIDSSGEVIWTKYLGESYDMEFSGLDPTTDGGLVVSVNDYEAGQVRLFKTDGSGNVLWERTFGDNARAGAVRQTWDGGCALLVTNGWDSSWVVLARYDATGSLLWNHRLGISAWTEAVALDLVSDDGFAVVGEASIPGTGHHGGYLARIDRFGKTLWERVFIGGGYDRTAGVVRTPDRDFAICGYLSGDGCLIKVDDRGFPQSH